MQRRRHTSPDPEESGDPSVSEGPGPSSAPGDAERAAPSPTAPSDAADDGAPAAGPATSLTDVVEAEEAEAEASPRIDLRSGLKHIGIGIVALVALLIAVRLLAPHVSWLGDTWEKVRKGDPVWLIAGVALEIVSFAGYVSVFGATTRWSGLKLPRVTSWRITLAGVAATRLLATAGAGGIAATAFALRRHGLDARTAAATVAAQIAIVYVWFLLLIFLTGMTLFAFGHAHAAITIIPAGISGAVLLVAVAGRPGLRSLARRTANREGRVAEALAAIPGTLDDAVRSVVTLVRERDPAVIGGALWWLADAGVLWVACHAFGASPNMLDVLMAYLLGQVANLLPIPGGLGVEAGLLGMLVAFDVPSGIALLASLTQRLISTWLPALPGALALAAIGHASPGAEIVETEGRPPPGRRTADGAPEADGGDDDPTGEPAAADRLPTR
ncbi:lysylphosphatidylglycerol synthase transmembrane domain-containing protein [Patulibacter defluvii]|uniref:lysylphosphatidylglycerol synthase transmembrane domain-containing protein n=1 Tax=Patulibacter defluvii TaxID=3095358 RepID=UPI002A752FFD|nr:lysylphosphatidylglycerol synthase transmembrane domain-containing protein [Patulibacter sp. DM4]